MNRGTFVNLAGLTPEFLPPRRVGGGAADDPARSDRVRVLFLHANELGFRTRARMLEQAAAQHDAVDALHIYLATRGLVRVLGVRGPYHSFRIGLAWALAHARWFAGPLPLDRFDVVVVSAQQRALAMALARGRGGRGIRGGRSGPRFVLDIDSTTKAWCRQYGLRKPTPDLDTLMERRIFARADLIAGWSSWVTDSLERDYGVPRARLTLALPAVPMPNADEAMSARRVRAAERAAAAAGSREPVRIVFVGHDWSRKGGDRLLTWHQALWADRAELHVCSGKAPGTAGLRGVVWHGATDHARLVHEILPRADLCVMPTRVEAMPVALMEAASAGLPIVSSRIAGIPDAVEHGRTGLLLSPEDDRGFVEAIGGLIDEPTRLLAMTLAAADRGREHLAASCWHPHLLDQIVRVARGRAPRFDPWSEDPDAEAAPTREVDAPDGVPAVVVRPRRASDSDAQAR